MVQQARIGAAKNTRFQSGRPKGGQMDLKKTGRNNVDWTRLVGH